MDERGPAPVVAALEEFGGAQGSGDVGSPVAADECPSSEFQCLGERGSVTGFRGGEDALGGGEGATHDF